MGEELAWNLQAGSFLLGDGSHPFLHLQSCKIPQACWLSPLLGTTTASRSLCGLCSHFLSSWGCQVLFPTPPSLLQGPPSCPAHPRRGHRRARLPSRRVVTCVCRIVRLLSVFTRCESPKGRQWEPCVCVSDRIHVRVHVLTRVLLGRIRLFHDPMDCSPPGSLSIGFPRQEHCSGLPFPPPGDLPDPRAEPPSPALAGGLFATELPGKPHVCVTYRGSHGPHRRVCTRKYSTDSVDWMSAWC